MSPIPSNTPLTTAHLRNSILQGERGPRPEFLSVTGSSAIYQTTQFPSSPTKYHNHYLLMRVEASFGACSYVSDQLEIEAAAQFSGLPLDVVLRDERLPVQIAAMDAYLGAMYPHSDHCSEKIEIPGGTPLEKASRRDALIADMAAIRPSEKVALIGVVNPLVAAIKQRGGICLPCDLQLDVTQWGETVEKDMNNVLVRADSVICTGMTLSNGTFDLLLERVRERQIPLTVYAQTGSSIVAQFLRQGVTALVAEPFPFTQFSAGTSQLYCYGSSNRSEKGMNL